MLNISVIKFDFVSEIQTARSINPTEKTFIDVFSFRRRS